LYTYRQEQLKIKVLIGLGLLEWPETPIMIKNSQGDNARCSTRDEMEIRDPSDHFHHEWHCCRCRVAMNVEMQHDHVEMLHNVQKLKLADVFFG